MLFECLKNPEHAKIDVIITSVPWTDTYIPLMAPAVLKPIVEKTGHSCLAVDLNIEILNAVMVHPEKDKIVDFFFHGKIHEDVRDWLEDIHVSMAQGILSFSPRYLGLSLLTYVSRQSCRWLCRLIKQMDPNVKIILGGAGCLEQFTGPALFADVLLDEKLADFHIRGDGENALFELLTGNTEYAGINKKDWKELDNNQLSQLPYPDYDDYIFDLYRAPALCLQGSRGCVRKCTFCDYIANWTKFQWRTADNIFEEMLLQNQKYGIRTFKFQDTLTNGNLKEFNRLIGLLAEYNRSNPDQTLTWSGYYIFRERGENDDLMWETIKASGATFLLVGIESLCQDIRFEIGKKFSNEAIDYHLEQAMKHNIPLLFLLILGYISETREHINFAKQWLDTHTKYQPILTFKWGSGLIITPNSYLDKNRDTLGIKMISDNPRFWVNEKIGSTPRARAEWINEVYEYSEKLGYSVVRSVDNHLLLEQALSSKS